MSYSNYAVPIGQGRFRAISRKKTKNKKKQSFLAVVDPEGVNKQGRVWEAGSSV